jgi:hypothetical protein
MKQGIVINIRGSDCSPEWVDEFNEWYCNMHVPMLMKSGDVEKVTRYRKIGDDEDYPRYLVIYEFEDRQAFERYEASPALAAAKEDANNRWPAGSYQPKWRVQYEAIEIWKK